MRTRNVRPTRKRNKMDNENPFHLLSLLRSPRLVLRRDLPTPTATIHPALPMKRTSVFALLFFILGALAPTVFAATGSISGNVVNAGTGRLLEGAKVELPKLGLSTLTDQTGRFLLREVPAGSHEIVATYLGLDALTATVVVASNCCP